MMKPGLSLLLLWSLWSTTGLGLGDFAPDGNTLNEREEKDGGSEPAAARWIMKERNEIQLPSITAAPILPTETLPYSSRLQARQTTTDSDDDDDDDDDDGPPPPPTPPPAIPDLAQASNSISNSVSVSVSSSVALSITGVFSSSLAALSVASSNAVISARQAGISEGLSSAAAGGGPPKTTAASTTSSPTSGTSSTSVASATGTDAASAIADVQTSASKAVEEAQSSASSSAQSAVEAAQASASAVTTTSQTQGSSLTPGQIGGIVISIAFISSLLSALATFLIMRRKARQQESHTKYEPDSLYAPRTQDPVLPPMPEPRPNSLSQSIRNRLSSFQAMFGAPIMPPYRRSQSPSNSNVDAFGADVKRRPPTAEHPAIAMSHNARPLSDPVFPVSPVSSVGDQSLILQGNEPEARLQPSPPAPIIVEGATSPVPNTSASARTSGAPTRVSLARQQSISGGQRPQLVRVGSGRERSGAAGDPLSMNPVCVKAGYDVAPVSATGQCHMVFPIHSPTEDGQGGWRTSAGTDVSSTPSFQVQAPIPRRLVDPVSLEQGPNYLPHAY